MRGSVMRDDTVISPRRMLRVASNASRPKDKQDQGGGHHDAKARDAEIVEDDDAASSSPHVLAAEPEERKTPSKGKRRRIPWRAMLIGGTALALAGAGVIAATKLGITVSFHPQAQLRQAASLPSQGERVTGPTPKVAQAQADVLGPPAQLAPPATPGALTVQTPPTAPPPPSGVQAGGMPPGSTRAAPGAPVAAAATSSAVAPPPPAVTAPAAPKALPAPAATNAPAPLTDDEKMQLELSKQIAALSKQVTGLATDVATLQGQMKEANQQLDSNLPEKIGELNGQILSLQHRADVMDGELKGNAHAAQSSAQAAQAAAMHPAPAPGPATPKPAPVTRPEPRHVVRAHEEKAAAPARPLYRVEAGAPGIAILQDAAGNATRVDPGSVIPGWGTVEAITPGGGGGWLIKTTGGVIH